MHRPFYGVLLAPVLVLGIYAGQHASPYDLDINASDIDRTLVTSNSATRP
jgi:hypothetical protein